MDDAWEQRLADAWASIDDYEETPEGGAEFRALIHDVTAELPDGDPVASYERGGSWDSTGHPREAIELYREAMDHGLDGARRRQCSVQLASSLRNLGEAVEGAKILQDELAQTSDHLDEAVRAFLALCLADAGRPREALGIALTALVPHLPRYQRSLTNYAADLRD